MPPINYDQLLQSLNKKEFVLFYQPIINCDKEESLFSLEGLTRWHKNDTYSPPKDFLPFIYKNPILNRLFCLNAIEQAAEFSLNNNCLIHVNLNTRNLLDPEVLQLLNKKLKSGSHLCIEIVEDEKVNNNFETIKTMQSLRTKGAIIALDDFGTGHHSISYLKNFPIDILKIDKHFLTDLGNKKNQDILKSLIDLGKNINIKVIVEGVENQEQLLKVSTMEADAIQGYYFSRPLHIMDASKYIDTKKKQPLIKEAVNFKI